MENTVEFIGCRYCSSSPGVAIKKSKIGVRYPLSGSVCGGIFFGCRGRSVELSSFSRVTIIGMPSF